MTKLKCPVDGCRSKFAVEPPLQQAKGCTVDCPSCGTTCIIQADGSLLTMSFHMSTVHPGYQGEYMEMSV